MIRKSLIMKIFDAAYMQRWNDKLRPIELIELDKQAHKMCIAYFIGKHEENEKNFNWIDIIEGGIFELLQRIIITDIKPPVFYKIKSDKDKYKKLNEFVYNELYTFISPLGEEFCQRYRNYFISTDNTINKKILSAAHIYASRWEFEIIERLNPDGYDIKDVKKDFARRIEQYNDLEGLKQITMHLAYRNFINMCGGLRFQARWSHVHRIPKTSVLGHSLFVAILSYLFSLETGACRKRCFNNFFTGLFHDLPEVLTRDIISPIKRSIEGLSDLIKEYEKEQMEKLIHPLVPKSFLQEIRFFTENEFNNYITVDNKIKEVSSTDIQKKYNRNKFSPKDGSLLKAIDELAAYIEAEVAIKNGCLSQEFQVAKTTIKNRFKNNPNISGINFSEILADF